MKFAVQALNDQALRAYNNLLSVISRLNLDIKTQLLLFDSLVVPILLYGSEVWGVYNYKEIDKLHFRFCKRILGVRTQTSNAAVLGELGRFPLSVLCKERALKQWLKIMKCPGSLMYNIFSELKSSENRNSNNSWTLSTEFSFEKYLTVLDKSSCRQTMSRFRLSSHNLEVENGRFVGIDRNDRICKMCSTHVENEYHFLLCCPIYRELRKRYCINYSFPTLNKFHFLCQVKI
ncbi:uncharacterized protein LOC132736534 [Ruditapes philippinarum]|uniref:uncharacterized protein LOC132736534 n=1 Tax=Ruditapes philippinarum TaxID=129788 RepID=UPI00295A85CD|nr:uncharacterized protein LOC132736534 [Ruditapes philippinarum]